MPQVQIIEPIRHQQTARLRVCAYARVSRNSEDQQHSFAAQVRYYTTLIASHEDWELVDIYADEGITGTRADKREDFQRMMQDCRDGKIDRMSKTLAEKRYASCGNPQISQTRNVKNLLEASQSQGTDTDGFLRLIVKNILLRADGEVQLRLINDQFIE